ncbi:MAG: hypothetical protein HY329_07210 [Chloroflexi bacterium]|nr:hypothetical protein [Chloroflexota bacterium]
MTASELILTNRFFPARPVTRSRECVLELPDAEIVLEERAASLAGVAKQVIRASVGLTVLGFAALLMVPASIVALVVGVSALVASLAGFAIERYAQAEAARAERTRRRRVRRDLVEALAPPSDTAVTKPAAIAA